MDEANVPMHGVIVYNVTVKVEKEFAKAWLRWMLEEHIPDVMQSGCFIKYKVLRLLEVDDSDGPTYAFQYTASSKDQYDQYINRFASALRQKTNDKWGKHIHAFRSVMEVVQ